MIPSCTRRFSANSPFQSRCCSSRYRWASHWHSRCPSSGWRSSLTLVIFAMPLLVPWNVVGTIWQIFSRGDIGLLGYVLAKLGIDYNYAQSPTDALGDRC